MNEQREPWEEITGDEVRNLEQTVGKFAVPKSRPSRFYARIASKLDFVKAEFQISSLRPAQTWPLGRAETVLSKLVSHLKGAETIINADRDLLRSLFSEILGQNQGLTEKPKRLKMNITGHRTSQNLDLVPEYIIEGDFGFQNYVRAISKLRECSEHTVKQIEQLSGKPATNKANSNYALYLKLKPIYTRLYRKEVQFSKTGSKVTGPASRFFVTVYSRFGITITPEAFEMMIRRKGR